MVRKKLAEFIPENSTLIMAFPVYGSDIPIPLKDLIPYLPEGGGRKLASVATMLLAGRGCCSSAGTAYERKGI